MFLVCPIAGWYGQKKKNLLQKTIFFKNDGTDTQSFTVLAHQSLSYNTDFALLHYFFLKLLELHLVILQTAVPVMLCALKQSSRADDSSFLHFAHEASLFSKSFYSLLLLFGCNSLYWVCVAEQAAWLTAALTLCYHSDVHHNNSPVFSNQTIESKAFFIPLFCFVIFYFFLWFQMTLNVPQKFKRVRLWWHRHHKWYCAPLCLYSWYQSVCSASHTDCHIIEPSPCDRSFLVYCFMVY